jgi:uncharacterized protein
MSEDLNQNEERARAREAVERVRQRAQQGIGAAPDAGHAVRFVAVLHQNLDRLFERSLATRFAPVCEAGCSYCCSVRVEVCEPEALLIADHLRQQPPAEQAVWLDRLRDRVATGHEQPGGARKPCEFLQEQQCSIYAVRPAACRKAHSLSVARCAQRSPTIPQNLDLLLQDETLMAGTFEAYRALGLPASPRELSAAVLDALEDAGAAERWFSSDAMR